MLDLRCVVVALAALACACGGTQTGTRAGSGDSHDAATSAAPDAGAAMGNADAAPGARLSKSDCSQLIDHVVQIAVVLHNKKEKPEYQPTKQQIAKIRSKLQDELGPACLRFERPMYDCVMAATDRASYAACARAK